MFTGFDLCCTDPAQDSATAGWDLLQIFYVDRGLSDVYTPPPFGMWLTRSPKLKRGNIGFGTNAVVFRAFIRHNLTTSN